MPDLTPDAWAQIRHAYEHTDRPVADICAEHGISTGTLRDRVRRWRWTRRRPPVPREGPPAVTQHEFASPPPIHAADGGEGSGVGGLGAARSADPPTPLRLADASRSDPPRRFAGGGMESAAPLPNVSGIEDDHGSEGEKGAAEPHVALGDDATAAAQSDPAAIAARLQGAVGRVLPAIEAAIAKLARGRKLRARWSRPPAPSAP